MKEININGSVMQCYSLPAAQRMHNYTVKYCPCPQVLNIGTGLYVQQDVDFGLLRQAVYKAYERFESMRLRFVEDEDGTVYQYVLLKAVMTLVFSEIDNMPEYHFDFRALAITLVAFIVIYELIMYCFSLRVKKLSVKQIFSE